MVVGGGGSSFLHPRDFVIEINILQNRAHHMRFSRIKPHVILESEIGKYAIQISNALANNCNLNRNSAIVFVVVLFCLISQTDRKLTMEETIYPLIYLATWLIFKLQFYCAAKL